MVVGGVLPSIHLAYGSRIPHGPNKPKTKRCPLGTKLIQKSNYNNVRIAIMGRRWCVDVVYPPLTCITSLEIRNCPGSKRIQLKMVTCLHIQTNTISYKFLRALVYQTTCFDQINLFSLRR